jgi:hypothetical protein
MFKSAATSICNNEKHSTHRIRHNVNNLHLGGYIADECLVWSCMKQTVRKMVETAEHLNMHLPSAYSRPVLSGQHKRA